MAQRQRHSFALSLVSGSFLAAVSLFSPEVAASAVSTSVFPNAACAGASSSGGLVGIGRVTLSTGEIETHCGCPSDNLPAFEACPSSSQGESVCNSILDLESGAFTASCSIVACQGSACPSTVVNTVIVDDADCSATGKGALGVSTVEGQSKCACAAEGEDFVACPAVANGRASCVSVDKDFLGMAYNNKETVQCGVVCDDGFYLTPAGSCTKLYKRDNTFASTTGHYKIGPSASYTRSHTTGNQHSTRTSSGAHGSSTGSHGSSTGSHGSSTGTASHGPSTTGGSFSHSGNTKVVSSSSYSNSHTRVHHHTGGGHGHQSYTRHHTASHSASTGSHGSNSHSSSHTAPTGVPTTTITLTGPIKIGSSTGSKSVTSHGHQAHTTPGSHTTTSHGTVHTSSGSHGGSSSRPPKNFSNRPSHSKHTTHGTATDTIFLPSTTPIKVVTTTGHGSSSTHGTASTTGHGSSSTHGTYSASRTNGPKNFSGRPHRTKHSQTTGTPTDTTYIGLSTTVPVKVVSTTKGSGSSTAGPGPSQASRLRIRAADEIVFGAEICAADERSCASGDFGDFTCVRLDDVTECGGCHSTGDAVNCMEIPGIQSAVCLRSGCVAKTCQPGWYQSSNGKCERA